MLGHSPPITVRRSPPRSPRLLIPSDSPTPSTAIVVNIPQTTEDGPPVKVEAAVEAVVGATTSAATTTAATAHAADRTGRSVKKNHPVVKAAHSPASPPSLCARGLLGPPGYASDYLLRQFSKGLRPTSAQSTSKDSQGTARSAANSSPARSTAQARCSSRARDPSSLAVSSKSTTQGPTSPDSQPATATSSWQLFLRHDEANHVVSISSSGQTDELYRAAAEKLRQPDSATTTLLHGGKPLCRKLPLSDYSLGSGSTIDVILTRERLLGGANGPEKRKANAKEGLRKPFKVPRLNSTSSSAAAAGGPSRKRPLAPSQRPNLEASLGQSGPSATQSRSSETSPTSTPLTSSFRSSALRRPNEIAPPACQVGNRRYSLTTIRLPTKDKVNLQIGGTVSETPAFAARLGQRGPTLLGADFAPHLSKPSKPSKPFSFVPKRASLPSRSAEAGSSRSREDLTPDEADPPETAAQGAPLQSHAFAPESDVETARDERSTTFPSLATPSSTQQNWTEKRARCLTKHGEWLQTEQQRARARLEARKEHDQTLVAVDEPLERVLRRANHRLSERKFLPPPLTSENVGSLVEAPNTLGLLNSLRLLSPLPADHPALELVGGDDPLEEDRGIEAGETSLARYYLRELEWPTAAAFFGFLDDCERFFPTETPRWTAWRDELEAQLGAGRNEQLPVTIPYAGMTIASTPIGRAEQDSNGALQTGMGQVLAVLQHDPPISEVDGVVVRRVYELVELRQPASSTLDANLPRIGNVEVALIANLHISLNSAEGRRLLMPDVSALEPFVTRANARWSALEELGPMAPVSPEHDEGFVSVSIRHDPLCGPARDHVQLHALARAAVPVLLPPLQLVPRRHRHQGDRLARDGDPETDGNGNHDRRRGSVRAWRRQVSAASGDNGRRSHQVRSAGAGRCCRLGGRCDLRRRNRSAIPTSGSDRQRRLEWLCKAKRTTDELVIWTGLGAYLEQARQEYLDVAQRLALLRGLGYYAWHEVIVVAHGGSFADAATHRSHLAKDRIAQQKPGPVFIGKTARVKGGPEPYCFVL